MNNTIWERKYHIKGTPTKEAQSSLDNEENYVSAELYYCKGMGYVLDLWKEARSPEGFARTFDFQPGRHKSYLVIKCNRPGTKRAQEALKLTMENLDAWLDKFTEGYEIEAEEVA
jgi:hypothetical protein